MFKQSFQLMVLTLAHTIGDLFGGLLGAILPALCSHFNLSLSAGLALITLMGMSSNVFQVLAGHVKIGGEKPWMISVGLLLASLIPLIGLFPPGHSNLFGLAGLLILAGMGVAWIHPDGLRGIHELHRIPSSVSTAMFMVGGFAGFSSGAWLSGAVVEKWGLRGLPWLVPVAVVMALLVPLARIRLSTAQTTSTPAAINSSVPSLHFGHLLAMGSLVAFSAVILTSLLPTYLFHLGFPMNVGGRSVFFFGLGGAAGSLFWGGVAHRKGYALAFKASLAIGIPCLIAYLLLAKYPAAVWLLPVAGFSLYAAYPLIVTLSRFARSRCDLGQRMGLIVGGCWGVAGIAVMALGPVGERIGLAPLLHLAWISYLATLVYGGFMHLSLRQPVP